MVVAGGSAALLACAGGMSARGHRSGFAAVVARTEVRRSRRRARRPGGGAAGVPGRSRSRLARWRGLRRPQHLATRGPGGRGAAPRLARPPVRDARSGGRRGIRSALRRAGVVGGGAHRPHRALDVGRGTRRHGRARRRLLGIGARLSRFRCGRGVAARRGTWCRLAAATGAQRTGGSRAGGCVAAGRSGTGGAGKRTRLCLRRAGAAGSASR